MNVEAFHARRRLVDVPSGRIAYVEQGQGPAAVFVHGVPLNGFHWRHVMAGLCDLRRCIALDLMGLGYTEISATQDVSFAAQARMIAEVLDAFRLERVDIVGTDSGGAVAQIFAATNPGRVRTLTLTNCDVHDNWPPVAIQPLIEGARKGVLIDTYAKLIGDPEARRARFSRAYANPSVLTEEVYRVYIDPLRATRESRDNFHRYWLAFDNKQTIAIEPLLRTLRVPTLIAWALDDIFFDVKWAHWLRDTIPGVVGLIEVPGAKLFFPEDRPQALVDPLRSFWTSGPRLPELRSEFLMQLRVELDPPLVLPDAPPGTRRILHAKSGSFSGPGLQGEVLPGGGDWVLDRRDGVAQLDIRFTLRTGDGQLVYVSCPGILDMAPQIRHRLRSGEDVDSSEYYFRTSPVFETGSEKYSRLNRMVAVGVGRRTATGMVTDVFEVK